MPQFDTFIFSSSLFYFILSLILVLHLNYVQFLPKLFSILKLRNKISGQNAKTQKKLYFGRWTKASCLLISLGKSDHLFSSHFSKYPFLIDVVLSSKNEIMNLLTIKVKMALKVWASIRIDIYRSVPETHAHYLSSSQYIKLATAPVCYCVQSISYTHCLINIKTRHFLINKLEIIRNYVFISLFLVFIIYTLNLSSLEVTLDCSLAMLSKSRKTLVCPTLKYSHIFARGVKGITPKNSSSSSKLPSEGDKGKTNENSLANNIGEGIENNKLPASEITKPMESETSMPISQGHNNSSKENPKVFQPQKISVPENKIKNGKGETKEIPSTIDKIKQSNIDYENKRNKELFAEKEHKKQSLLTMAVSNNNNRSKMIQTYEQEEEVVEWPSLPSSEQSPQNIPPDVHGILVQDVEKYCKDNKEDKICEQLVENQMAKSFNINTRTTSSISKSKAEDPLKISLSEKLCERAFQIEGLTEFMKIKPNQLSSISKAMSVAHEELGELLKQFCNDNSKELTSFINKENLQEYKKIYSEGSENLSIHQKYTHDAIFGTLWEELKTREQLQTNIDTLQKIKKSIDQDLSLTPKLLIELAKKLGVVEYRDANYTGKVGDVYELVVHKQKEVGQLELRSRSLFEKTEREIPDITRDEILTMIKEKNFQAIDINIKDPKYDQLFLPSGVTGHTCIAINYKNKFLIVAYLTSETDCPKICDSQLHDQKKTQHLYVLSNFCIEEISTTITNSTLKEYLDFSKTLDKIVEVIYDSQSFANALISPTIETPITTFENVKQLVVEKADSLLITFQKSLKQYPMESSIVNNHDKNKKVKFILKYLKNNLDDNSKQLLNWYLEMITHKKELTSRENQVINSLNKEKNKQIIDIHE